jgi:hypothetical protein
VVYHKRYVAVDGCSANRSHSMQEYIAAQELLKKYETLHYLEYESYRFTTAAGRTWEVYGSPVWEQCQMFSMSSWQVNTILGRTQVCPWCVSV